MDREIMILTFFKLSTVYIKKLGQFFFHAHYLTCLDKDVSVPLKFINTWKVYKSSRKTIGLKFFKNTMYMHIIPLIRL